MHIRLAHIEKKIEEKEIKEEQDKSKVADTPIETFDAMSMMSGMTGY